MNTIPHLPRGVMSTGGIIRQILGTRKMYVEDMTANFKCYILCV